MLKTGLVLNNFGMSQLAYFAIREGNKLLTERSDVGLFGFYQNLVPPCTEPDFALMHSFELYTFDGTLISTDISTTKQSLESFSASRRLFYVWDLEWIRHKASFSYYEQFYCNPKLELFARSEEHAQLISNCWNKPCSVIENFNLGQLIG